MTDKLKAREHFSTDHLLINLKAKTIQGTSVTIVAQGTKFLIQLMSIAVLARLLEPADFGLVAMVTVVTGLFAKFADGGLSMATIQRQHITHEQVTNLFWVNMGLGLVLTILTIALAPIIARIYNEPQLIWICVAMSLSFLVGSLSVQHQALLVRQMQFRSLAYIDVSSMGLGVVVGVASAWAGFGYWSLVAMTMTASFSKAFLIWLTSDWRPGWVRTGTGVRPLLAFGLHLSGANFVGYLASNLTPFVIGLLGGAQSLGLFNRANTLTALPSTQVLPPIMSVAQPALSRVVTESDRFKRATLSLIRKICLFAMFVAVIVAVMADWIVEIFLGVRWAAAVPIVRLLAVFTLVEPIAAAVSMVIIARGRTDAIFRWKLITLGVITVSIATGALWGEYGVIFAYSISGLLIRFPGFIIYASQYVEISIFEFMQAITPFLLVAILFLPTSLVLKFFLGDVSAIFGASVFTFMSAVIYIALGCLAKDVRMEMLDVFRLAVAALK